MCSPANVLLPPPSSTHALLPLPSSFVAAEPPPQSHNHHPPAATASVLPRHCRCYRPPPSQPPPCCRHRPAPPSQVDHVLVDRLNQFLSDDLQATKDARKRLDKATYTYDQAREKVASLKKTTRDEVVTELEEALQNSKPAFEKSRYIL